MTAKKYNPKSMANLRQYKAVTVKKSTKKAETNLQKDAGVDVDKLNTIIPVAEIFSGDEIPRFYKYFGEVVKELGQEDSLRFSDYEDIAQLCKNKILEDRLLISYKKEKKEAQVYEIMNALDKFKKENAKIKEQLGSVRRERFDPRTAGDITLQDLLVSYDRDAKSKMQERLDALAEAEKEVEDSGKVVTSRDKMIQ
jgi:hypothetical protein